MKISTFAIFVFLGQGLWANPQSNKIIGTNDLVLVDAEATNIPLKYKDIVNAFGLMSMGCTATHIGGGYVLTAGHCFFAGQVLKRDLPCPEIRIEWGVRDGLTPYLVSKCERITAIQLNGPLDFAILKVSPAPSAQVAIDCTNKPLAGDTVTIFSHPDELPLHWSKTCVVEEGAGNSKLPADTLYHTCDTNQGSSGALILNTDSLKAVAIHAGGQSDATGAMNYGSYLSHPEIADILKELGF